MPRIRSVKPEFWSDTRMSKLDALTRLVYLCLWSMADDEGRLEGDAEAVRRFGSFREDSRELARSLATLAELRRIVAYEVDSNPYIAILRFNKHQKIDHAAKSKLPVPPMTCDDPVEILANPRESSRILAPDQGSGIREGIRERDKHSPDGECLSTTEVVDAQPPPAGRTKKPAYPPPVDHQAVIDAYHAALPAHQPVVSWTERRKALLRQRWRELALLDRKHGREWADTAAGVARFAAYFAWVGQSKFLTGRVPAAKDKRPFLADLEWLLSPSNMTKVVEGKYHEEAA